ncbi:hypothetical protein PPYR_00451 [Photinus pyralis]|uniref:Mif2/CENP-C cupin domain-containing protein n=2 Tax=Photinus pyralis TaxID=7054 RepID=A0A5N4B1J9_PHOPY|nr:uncharacterized protein LOC116176841 [Photinus pyralis]KAB0803481.1 hypothetical protein PPYR_00451 [Photinus pyralis]
MAQYDLYNSPSFLPIKGDSDSSSSSSSNYNSYELYKDMQRIPNVPMPSSLNKRKRLFTAGSPKRTKKLHDYLMQAKLSLVTSTPRVDEAYCTSGFTCGLSPVALRRDSIIHINGRKSTNINNNNCSVKVAPRHRMSLKNIKLKKRKGKRIGTKVHKRTNKAINTGPGNCTPTYYEERETQTSNSCWADGKTEEKCISNPINLLKDKLIGNTDVLRNSFSERIQSIQSPRSPFKINNSISKIVSNIDRLSYSPASPISTGSDKVENGKEIFKYPQKDNWEVKENTMGDKRSVNDHCGVVKEKEVPKISECLIEENRSTLSNMPTNDRVLRSRSRTPQIPEICIEQKKRRTTKKKKGAPGSNIANSDSEMKVSSPSESRHHTLEGSHLNPSSFINCNRLHSRLTSRLLSDCSSVSSEPENKQRTLEGFHLNPTSFVNCNRMRTRQASRLLSECSSVSTEHTLRAIPENLSESVVEDRKNSKTNNTKRKKEVKQGNNTQDQDTKINSEKYNLVDRENSSTKNKTADSASSLENNQNSVIHLTDCRVECVKLSRNKCQESKEVDIVREKGGGSVQNFEISRQSYFTETIPERSACATNYEEQNHCVPQTENTIYSAAINDKQEIIDVKDDDLTIDQINVSATGSLSRALRERCDIVKDLIDNGAPDVEDIECVKEQHVQSLPTGTNVQTRNMKKRTCSITTQPSESGHNTNGSQVNHNPAEFVIPTKGTKVPSKTNKKPNTRRKTNAKKPPPNDTSEDTPITNNSKRNNRNSTQRKTTNEHIVLKQYIRTRKSGFVRLEETQPSYSEDSTANDTGRPRRTARPPRAFIQATFVDTRHIRKLSSASTVSTNSDRKNTTRKTSTTSTRRKRTTKINVSIKSDTIDNDHVNETNATKRRKETKTSPNQRKHQATKTDVSPNGKRTEILHSVDQDTMPNFTTTENCEPSTRSHDFPQAYTLPTLPDDSNIPAGINETGVTALDGSADDTIVPIEDNAEVSSTPKVIILQNMPIPSGSKVKSREGGSKINNSENENYGQKGAVGPSHSTDHIIQAVVNNQSTPLQWFADPPQLDASQNISVMFCLTNLKSHMCTSSCGFILYGPGQKKSSFPKNHALVYKVERGNAEVTQQFITRTFGVSACFYIPLGSPYTIKNLSDTEPLILFFTKIGSLS